MKKFRVMLAVIVISLVIGMCTVPVSAAESNVKNNGQYIYNILDENTCVLYTYLDDPLDVEIPEQIDGYNVIAIHRACFGDKSLQTVKLNKQCRLVYQDSIYDSAVSFMNCESLNNIYVPEENPYYSADNGILFNKTKDIIYCYPNNKAGKEYIIPETVTHIGSYVFYKNNLLEKIQISNKITLIVGVPFNDDVELAVYNESYAHQWAIENNKRFSVVDETVEVPTEAPTETPTEDPTEEPTVAPTEEPTVAPTEEPTVAPTEEPTVAPTEDPTEAPTEEPTEAPTEEPTVTPTEEPTVTPTKPTEVPTQAPTVTPAPISPTPSSNSTTTTTTGGKVAPVVNTGEEAMKSILVAILLAATTAVFVTRKKRLYN